MLDVGDLAELQAIDLPLDALRRTLADIAERLAHPPYADLLEQEITAQAALAAAAVADRRTAETLADATRAKIQAEDAKLYSGQITDHRELRQLQEEIYGLRRLLKTQEEHVLAQVELEEAEQAAATYLQSLAQAIRTAWEAHCLSLEARRAVVQQQADTLQDDVTARRAEIAPQVLAAYDAQRQQDPLVVVQAVGGICSGCRLNLPMNIVNRARRRTELVRCPCPRQRFLYVL